MGIEVTVETTIARPPEDVAAYAMDPANDARWIAALTSVNVLTSGPVAVGTQVERVAKFLGKEITYVNEIEAYDPPRRLAMRSIKAPFPMTVVYEFEAVPAGTLARIRAGGDATGFYGVAAPLLSKMTERGIRRDLENLKSIFEAD